MQPSKVINNITDSITKMAQWIVLLCAITFFVPGMKDIVFGLIENGKDFQPVYINIGDINVNLDIGFELPKFEFDVASFEMPTITFNVVFILVALALIILSSFSPIISFISTILFGGVALHFSIQAVTVYKNMVANGSTNWQAACASFGVLFCVYLVVLANGLFGLSGTVFKYATSNAFTNWVLSFFFALLFAAAGALVVSLICLGVLALGWAGGVYLGFAVAAVIALFGELINLVAND